MLESGYHSGADPSGFQILLRRHNFGGRPTEFEKLGGKVIELSWDKW